MEENELYDRIGETDLNPTYKDGQPYMHTDVNQMLGILKTAVNENYYDIQKLQNGEKTVGNAEKLDGAEISRYIDEELQADDDKIPSSQQAKAYMDALFAGYSAPVRGVDYWTEADQQQIVSDAANSVISEITPDLEEALAAKANINDIPTKVSDLTNDSEFITSLEMQESQSEQDTKINKKPYYFNSVADMKATNLKAGDCAITLGYYASNDGGAGTYKIVNETLTDDGGSVHELNNGLFAKLIIENNTINIKQFGALSQNDIHDYVLAILDKNYECYIPEGVWKTTPLQIAKYNSARISGEEIYGNNNSNGTILTPVGNQAYIMKVGYDNTTSIANDISIKNIQFNTNGYTCVNALLFSRVQFSNFEELCFRKCKCSDCAFRIRETWETRFGRVLFRQTDAPYTLIFGAKVGSGNISSNYFEFLSFEGSRGNCIKFEENSQYSMSTIDTIDFESGTVAFDDEERVSINSVDSYTSLCIIETVDGKGEISINNLNINSISQHAYVNTTTEEARAYDTVIKCNNTDTGYYSFAIGTISGVGNVNTPTLINANSLDKFYCNNNIFQGGTHFNSYVDGCRVFRYLPNEFADKFINANINQAYRDLRIDGVSAYCKGTPGHAVRVANLVTKGSKLKVHAKGNGNINFGGSDHITLSNVTDYDWFEIDMVASSIGSRNNILLGTNTTVEIDDYFFVN